MAPPLLTLSFLAIVFCTLFPFNFTVPHGMTLRQAAAPFNYWDLYDPSNLMDTPNNVVLFIPFGFSLACLARTRHIRTFRTILLAGLISCIYSCTIEFLQQWLPLRDSSLADILSNTTGGMVGAAVFLLIGMPVLRFSALLLTRILRRFSLLIATILFLFLLACVLRGLLRMRHINENLASWNMTFPLVVGNVPQADRGWKGTVSSIEIASQAVSPAQITAAYASHDLRDILGASVLASYRINGSARVVDLTHQSPDLIWDGPDVAQETANSPTFAGGDFLISASPLSRASHTIREKSAFTVRCRFQSDLPSQSPWLGRIVAIASDSMHCNLAIVQENFDLVIQLATPLTGANGNNPAWKIDDFFVQPGPHDLIVTYDDPVLRVYADNPRQLGAASVPTDFGGVTRYLARSMTLPFYGFLPELYRGAFFLISFAPLGLILAVVAANTRLAPKWRNLAVAIGLITPALAVQFVLVVICRRSFRTDNLLMGLAAMALVAFSVAHWLKRLDKAKVVG